MKDRRIALKVKIKSLACEATIIRLEEQRAKARGDYRLFWELRSHRTEQVRDEARYAQFAYAILRFRQGFPVCVKPLDEERLIAMVLRFGPVRQPDETEDQYLQRMSELESFGKGYIRGMQLLRSEAIERLNATAGDRAAKRIVRRIRCEEAHAKRRQLPPEKRERDGMKSFSTIEEMLEELHQ